MKTHFTLSALLFLISLLLFSDCSKTSDPAPSASLVGSWVQTSTTTTGCTNTVANFTDLPCGNLCNTIVFTATTFTLTTPLPQGGTHVETVNYTTSDGKLITTDTPVPYTVSATTFTMTLDLGTTGTTAGCKATVKFIRK